MRTDFLHVVFSLSALGLLSSCATSRALAPLEKGQSGMTVSFGGPFVKYGSAPIPVPISSIGYRYGIDGKTDVHAAFYPTAAAALGVAAFDIGFARQLIDADGGIPRIMLDVNTTWMGGDNHAGNPKGGFRFFPEASLIFTWELGAAEHKIYVGADVFVQPFPSVHALFTPMFGTELMASKVVGVQLEVNWVQPTHNTLFGVPEWYGPGNQGAVGFKLGLNFKIPTKRAHPKLAPPRAQEPAQAPPSGSELAPEAPPATSEPVPTPPPEPTPEVAP